MPAKSKAQRRFMAMCAHGKPTRARCPTGMTKKQMHDFSTTSERNLPQRKSTEKR